MTLWFTSDQHYGHQNIIAFAERPFTTLSEMTHELIRRFNETVGPDDTTIHLGDFSLGLDEEGMATLLTVLSGRHLIVPGNHDRSRASLERAGFVVITPPGQYRVERQLGDLEGNVVLSHYPYYYGDHPFEAYDLKYIDRRPRDEGKWLLHGHVHQAWKFKDKQINVGVDCWDFYPVSEDQLVEVIENEKR